MRTLGLRLILLATALGGAQAAPGTDDEDLALAYGDAATVSIATGSKQSLRRAPAVASVFTAEDIRAMGASDLSQVLERVPGLHVSKSFYLYDPRYFLRGIGNELSQQLLILIDGVRRQTPTLGGPEEAWVSMPVDQIARVEVIRGPGSALYGADAFSGVVAITTWRGQEDLGTKLRTEVGGDSSRSISLRHGQQRGDWAWHAYFRVAQTDGAGEVIEADAQSALDALFGTQASQAPGPLHSPHRALDGTVVVNWRDWEILGSYKKRSAVGTGPGLAAALSGRDRVDVHLGVLGISYQRADWLPNWDLQARASRTGMSGRTDFQLYPPGAFGGLFPEGMRGTPGRSTRVGSFEAVASYGGVSGQRLRLGLGGQDVEVYETYETKNFDLVLVPGVGTVPVPLGSMVDVSQSKPYMRPQLRRLHYVLAQHEWQFNRGWALTLGLRQDRYSDFGRTTNPRAALVWDARHDLTLKALHGRAFRAPSFGELYILNNPIQLGNPTLRPERMASSELVAEWQPSRDLHATVNLFRYRVRDILRLVPNSEANTGATNQNQGSQRGHGYEAELNWQASRSWRVNFSLSAQEATDQLTGTVVGDAPKRMWKVGLDGSLSPDWHLNAQALQIESRPRGFGDTRRPVPDYALLDVSLQWRRTAAQGWQGRLALRNALDRDAREPSPAPGQIPNDYPLPRRTVQLELGYGF